MFKFVGIIFIGIKKLFGLDEAFRCPCCGKKVYFCSPKREDLVRRVLIGKFVHTVEKSIKAEKAFADIADKLSKLPSDDYDVTDDDTSLYAKAMADVQKKAERKTNTQ